MRQTDDWIVKLPVQNPNMMAFCGPDLRVSMLRAQRAASAATPTRAASFACVSTCRVLLALFTPVETRFLEDVANI